MLAIDAFNNLWRFLSFFRLKNTSGFLESFRRDWARWYMLFIHWIKNGCSMAVVFLPCNEETEVTASPFLCTCINKSMRSLSGIKIIVSSCMSVMCLSSLTKVIAPCLSEIQKKHGFFCLYLELKLYFTAKPKPLRLSHLRQLWFLIYISKLGNLYSIIANIVYCTFMRYCEKVQIFKIYEFPGMQISWCFF